MYILPAFKGFLQIGADGFLHFMTKVKDRRNTCTVALGNQAIATKICSLMERPDPNTTQNDTTILTPRPIARTATPRP